MNPTPPQNAAEDIARDNRPPQNKAATEIVMRLIGFPSLSCHEVVREIIAKHIPDHAALTKERDALREAHLIINVVRSHCRDWIKNGRRRSFTLVDYRMEYLTKAIEDFDCNLQPAQPKTENEK